jgi:hypothetical protein
MMSTELDFSFGSRTGCAAAVHAKTARNSPAAARSDTDGFRWVKVIDYLRIPAKYGKLT